MAKDPPLIVAIRHIVALMVVVWSGFPILLVVMSSFKPSREIFAVPPSFVFTPTLQHYRDLVTLFPHFFDAAANSLIVTAGATAVTVIVSTMSGYVYSRYRGRLLTASAFFTLFIRMLPPIIVILPLFPAVNLLRLNDTHIVLILMYAALQVSLSTWIMKVFIDAIPRELEEAAYVDGASVFALLVRIVLPLAIHGIIASAIFALVFSWNEFLFAFVFTSTNARTTPLVISEMLDTIEGVEWGILFAAATIQLVPIIVFVLAVQRFIVAGLTAGSVKS